MGKLKLTNQTGWNTMDLRLFVRAGLKAEIGKWWGTYYVDVRNRRRYFGRGMVNGLWIGLYPEPGVLMDGEDLIRFAQTLAHEVQHNKGERHGTMTVATELPVEWAHTLLADGFAIRQAEVKLKPKRDIVNERHIHAAKMLAMHDAKLRREEKLVKRWAAKVRYYERRAQKKAADKGE